MLCGWRVQTQPFAYWGTRCGAPDSPGAGADDSAVPLWIVLLAVGAVVLLLIAIVAYMRLRVRVARIGVKTQSGLAFSDAGKYTINFTDVVDDEELELYSRKRTLDFDDI